MTRVFDHERLDVYQVAIEFVVAANNVVEHLPRGQSHLADPLHRASTSVPLDIAEGAGETSAKEKARCDRMACRSGTECAAILDISPSSVDRVRRRWTEEGVEFAIVDRPRPGRPRMLAPKHASWLNAVESEISVLERQCLNRRIASESDLRRETRAWQRHRNQQRVPIRWK